MDKRIKQVANKRAAPRLGRSAAVEDKDKSRRKLDGLGCRRARLCRGGPGKCIPARFLFWTLVDFDGAFEVGAVFDHDSRSGQVTVDRTILLDFNSILGAKVALHV